jgi:hypothetical protein
LKRLNGLERSELTEGDPIQNAFVRLAVVLIKQFLTSLDAVRYSQGLRVRTGLIKLGREGVHDRDDAGDRGVVDLDGGRLREPLGGGVHQLCNIE